MRRAPFVAGIATIVVVVLAFVTGSTAAKHPTGPVGTAALTARTVVCPAVNGAPGGTSTTMTVADLASAERPPAPSSGVVAATSLAPAKSRKPTTLTTRPVATIGSKTGARESISVGAVGEVAATIGVDEVVETASSGRYRGLLSVGCESPATNWWFVGADGRVGYSDGLILSNPASTTADVAVSLYTAKGVDSPPHLGSFPVPAHSRVILYLASVAPDIATIAIHVHAQSGAVEAALIDRRTSALKSDGGDFIPPTRAPAKAGVISGYDRGDGPRKLELANPGDVDATVNLKLITKAGTFVPAGANQIVVKAQHTRIVDLTKVFGAQTGAVEWTSDSPVVGEGLVISTMTGLRPDLMWLAATPPLSGPAAIANGHEPDGGASFLILTAPAGAAEVVVSTPAGKATKLSVPAGHSVGYYVTSTIQRGKGPWPYLVTPVGSAPVYGATVLSFRGAHGALITGEPLLSLPHPIRLPQVREDPRVAVAD